VAAAAAGPAPAVAQRRCRRVERKRQLRMPPAPPVVRVRRATPGRPRGQPIRLSLARLPATTRPASNPVSGLQLTLNSRSSFRAPAIFLFANSRPLIQQLPKCSEYRSTPGESIVWRARPYGAASFAGRGRRGGASRSSTGHRRDCCRRQRILQRRKAGNAIHLDDHSPSSTALTVGRPAPLESALPRRWVQSRPLRVYSVAFTPWMCS
jgi:hypothetical protein